MRDGKAVETRGHRGLGTEQGNKNPKVRFKATASWGNDVGFLKVEKILETMELNISWPSLPAMCLTHFK